MPLTFRRRRKGCLCDCGSCVEKVWRRKTVLTKMAQLYIPEEVTTAGAQMMSSGFSLLFTPKPSLSQGRLHPPGSFLFRPDGVPRQLQLKEFPFLIILKLQYYGHLMRRVDSLEKTMLEGIGGRRRRGRQRVRWHH